MSLVLGRSTEEAIEIARDKANAQFFNNLWNGGSNKIGKRGTLTISYWAMREKWKKHGRWWTYIGSDGDCEMVSGRLEIPRMLQLFYVLMPGEMLVQQLCWERSDLGWDAPRHVIGEKSAFIFNTPRMPNA